MARQSLSGPLANHNKMNLWVLGCLNRLEVYKKYVTHLKIMDCIQDWRKNPNLFQKSKLILLVRLRLGWLHLSVDGFSLLFGPWLRVIQLARYTSLLFISVGSLSRTIITKLMVSLITLQRPSLNVNRYGRDHRIREMLSYRTRGSY